jgi:hypothetical protein
MKTLRIQNSSVKTLRVYSTEGVAATAGALTGPVILPGASVELAVDDGHSGAGWANITLDSNLHQWVCVWWRDSGAMAQAHTDNRSPLLLRAVVAVRGGVCEVTISAPGQRAEFAIAPGHAATVDVQPTSWSIEAVMRRFQDLVADEDLLQRGQFVWYSRFEAELRGRWRALLRHDAVTRDVLAPLGDVYAALTNGIVDYDDAGFERQRSRAYHALSTSSASGPNRSAVLAMLVPAGNGLGIYQSATSWFRAGHAVRKDSPTDADRNKYEELFRNPAMVTFATAKSLLGKCAVECYGWTEAVNAHIDSRTRGAGLRGLKTGTHHAGLDMPISYTVNKGLDAPGRGHVPGAGHILVYRGNLGGSTGDGQRDGPIYNLALNLDHGLLVTAYCLSGLYLDHAGDANNPLEHWLLLLGYERTTYGFKFPFWDPDAGTSLRQHEVEGLIVDKDGRTATGFGLLHFVAAGAVAHHGDPPSTGLPELFAKSGRFSTESKNGGILVNDRGVHVNTFGFDSGETGLEEQHRYQVGMLKPFATAGA